MDKTARFAAINTKVRALEGKLLSDEDYMNLLSQKTVSGIAGYLKHNTFYSSNLQDIDENAIHRRELENILKNSLISNLENISYYFHDNYKRFYRVLFIRYEIEDLKSILRKIKIHENNSGLRNSYVFLGRYSKVNMDELLSSKDYSEFITKLRGTVYYEYLRPLNEMSGDIDMFNISMVLDLAYFDMFYKNLKLINKPDRAVMELIQGSKADLLNIQWIYRGLKFYNLSTEELFNYTISNGREFSRTDIKGLCYSGSLDEFQKKILNTRYSFLFDQENTKDVFMERRTLRYQYFNLKRLKTRGGMNIGQTMVYSLLREYEIRDIISIIESIRYEMPVEEAKKFMIRKL